MSKEDDYGCHIDFEFYIIYPDDDLDDDSYNKICQEFENWTFEEFIKNQERKLYE